MVTKRMVVVPVALPGSGKTRYHSYHPELTRIDMDKYIGRKLPEVLLEVMKTPGNLYLDGLFLTNELQDIIVQTLVDSNVEFLYFNVSREKCLENDEARIKSGERTKSSKNTILYAKVEKPKQRK